MKRGFVLSQLCWMVVCSAFACSGGSESGGGSPVSAGNGGSAGAAGGSLATGGSQLGVSGFGSGGTFTTAGTANGGTVSFGGALVTAGNANGGSANAAGSSGTAGSLDNGGGGGTGPNLCPPAPPAMDSACGAPLECEYPNTYCECNYEEEEGTGAWACETDVMTGTGGQDGAPEDP